MKIPSKYGIEADQLLEDDFFENDDWICDLELSCDHPNCSCIAPDFDIHKYIKYSPVDLMSQELRQQLKDQIREMEKEPIDWHPGSNQQVRNLIHQSMYCYVKGVSRITKGESSFVEPECKEEVRYQWLPSEFKIGADSKVKLMSYINNLDTKKYPNIIPLLEKSLEFFLPSLEQVLKTRIQNKNLQLPKGA